MSLYSDSRMNSSKDQELESVVLDVIVRKEEEKSLRRVL